MFGLRPDVDQVASSLSKAHGKSYKFAERNTGRFFVSGVSGSFQKFTKEKEIKSKRAPRPIDKVREQSRGITIDRLAEDNDAESIRLQAMEKRLEELRWEKEQRRIRERKRRHRKVIFVSACRIQNAWRRYKRNDKKEACAVVISFIKTLVARQALAAAAWAARVIRHFAERCTARFILKKKREERDQRYIEVTNDIASQLVNNLIMAGMVSETNRQILFKKYRSPKKGGSPMKRKQQHTNNNNSPMTNSNSSPYKQFFLTEFDSTNAPAARGSSNSGDSKLSPLRKSKDEKKINANSNNSNNNKRLSPDKPSPKKVEQKPEIISNNVDKKKKNNIDNDEQERKLQLEQEKRLQEQERRHIQAEKLQLRLEQQKKIAIIRQRQLEEEEERKRKKKEEEDEEKRQRRKELEEKLKKRKEAEEEEKRRRKKQEEEEELRRRKKEEEDEEDDRRRRGLLSNKHDERLKIMEDERLRRLNQIESLKAEKERQDQLKKEAEVVFLAEKMKKKQDFLQRLEDEQISRARNVAKLRDIRLKEAKRKEEERAREAQEIRHMRMEDPNIRAGGLRLKRRIFLPNPNTSNANVSNDNKSRKDNIDPEKSKKAAPIVDKGNDSEDDERRVAEAREKVKARVSKMYPLILKSC